ncbi:MAG: Gfo/Idh/MocA family oxidoreductase [Candidatus Sulfopaludibacter sp.]|nr:Gfo/Idh/MocA family oxidoreductase [Candidatus Sulfopaludibacter sp.]
MLRRDFLKSSAAFASATAAARAQNRPSPSNRITMGVIGTGNQGTGDMKNFLADERVQVVAVCDLNKESPGYWDGAIAGREPARVLVEWNYARAKRSGIYKGCTAYEDFRDLLARKDIDTVLIAVPDHWHSIPVIQAARAGKDIYGEKPLSLTISEGRAMASAVKANNRVFQCGSQQRSDVRFRKACEIVRNGGIGKLETVLVGLPGGTPDFGHSRDRQDPEPVPEGFNYAMWLGPAPEAPYAPARCHVNFRWILDYSGGQITDWGGHHPDIAQWGMGTELTGPVAIRNGQAQWAKEKIWNTAVDYYFEAHYASGVVMTVSSRLRSGVTFQGSDGSVWVNRGAIEATPQSLLDWQPKEQDIHLYRSDNHARNFIDCVISRKETAAPIEQAHRSITIAHLGNISLRLGRDLRWDPAKEQIIGDESASQMLARPMRKPWSITV